MTLMRIRVSRLFSGIAFAKMSGNELPLGVWKASPIIESAACGIRLLPIVLPAARAP